MSEKNEKKQSQASPEQGPGASGKVRRTLLWNKQFLVTVAVMVFLNLAIAQFLVARNKTQAWLYLGITFVILVGGLIWAYRGVTQLAGKRTTRYAVLSTTMSLVFLGILVFVVYTASLFEREFDMTEGRIYTLEDQEINLLKNLKRPVRIVGFFHEMIHQGEKVQVREILDRMKRVNPEKFSYEFIDPMRETLKAALYADDLRNKGYPSRPIMLAEFDVAAERGALSATEELALIQMASPKRVEIQSETESSGGAFSPQRVKFDNLDISNALIRLTRTGDVRVYFVTGHGESDINDTSGTGLSLLRQELERLQYQVNEFSFRRVPEIPADCSILVIAGPEMDYSDAEIEAIDAYVRAGGRLLVMLEPGLTPRLARQMEAYGLKMPDEIVVEVQERLGFSEQGIALRAQATLSPIVPVEGFSQNHEITRGLRFQTEFLLTRPVLEAEQVSEGVTVTTLAETAGGEVDPDRGIPYSWTKKDAETIANVFRGRGGGDSISVAYDPAEDRRGPISIGAAVEMDLDTFEGAALSEERKSENALLVCFGNVRFCQDASFRSGQPELAINSFNWLSAQEDLITSSIDVAARDTSIRSDQAGAWITWLPLICIQFMPMLFVTIGILNFFWRRKYA